MLIDLSVVGKPLPSTNHQYGEQDVMLYALGVGVGAEPDELDFVYERNLEVLPTFCVIPAFPALFAMGSAMAVKPALAATVVA